MNLINRLVRLLILPKSADKDVARREFVLNILLAGLIVLSFVGFAGFIYYYLSSPGCCYPSNIFLTSGTLLFMTLLLWLSRSGKSRISAYLFTTGIYALALYSNHQWGSYSTPPFLLYTLLIITAGIISGSKLSFISTILAGITLTVFSYAEIYMGFQPDTRWKDHPVFLSDTLVNIVVMAIIAMVAWLSNRENEKLLRRARISEAALQRERDSLEIKVEERTAELKQAQSRELAQWYRFAVFGKLAAGMLHDLINPLNSVFLNLEQLSRESRKRINPASISDLRSTIKRAMQGAKNLDSCIGAARKQILNQNVKEDFSITNEIKGVISLLSYKAAKNGIKINLHADEDVNLVGNPFRFSQMTGNLISNAVEAYEGMTGVSKEVNIDIALSGKKVTMFIQDYGVGIAEENINNIFEPFFTNKSSDKGMGIGLFICKEIAQKDFGGDIKVKSKKGQGSTFTVEIPLNKNVE
jgi:signal transduction histidine kinase